jgi:prepilin peptidase CpaA
LIVLAVAVYTDLRSRRIPNWLVLPFVLLGIVVSPWRADWRGPSHHIGWHGVGLSFAGLGLGFLLFGILFWMGGMGAGDVKLFAALGAWIGPQQILWSLFFTSLAGGFIILSWIAYRVIFKKLFLGVGRLVFGWKPQGAADDASLADLLKRKIPYAPAIAIGTLMSFFAG